jgi:zinc protease
MNIITQRLFLAAALGLSFVVPVHAQVATPASASLAASTPQLEKLPWLYEGSDLPVDKSWAFGIFPNGLRYAVKQNDSEKGKFTVRLRVNGGRLRNSLNEQIISRLFSQMSYSDYASNLPNINGNPVTTDFSITATQTVYELQMSGARNEALYQQVNYLARIIRNPDFSEKALDSARRLIRTEIQKQNITQSAYDKHLREHLFQGQLLSSLGNYDTEKSLDLVDYTNVKKYHESLYQPNNIAIVIVGDASIETLVSLVSENFKYWQVNGTEHSEVNYGDVSNEGSVVRVIVNASSPENTVIAYLRPWEKIVDSRSYWHELFEKSLALQIINRRLGELAKKRRSFAYAEVAQERISRVADVTTISIQAIDGKWGQSVIDVLNVISSATKNAPNASDVEREVSLFSKLLLKEVELYPKQSNDKQTLEMIDAINDGVTTGNRTVAFELFETGRSKFTSERMLTVTKQLFSKAALRAFLSVKKATSNDEIQLEEILSNSKL